MKKKKRRCTRQRRVVPQFSQQDLQQVLTLLSPQASLEEIVSDPHKATWEYLLSLAREEAIRMFEEQ